MKSKIAESRQLIADSQPFVREGQLPFSDLQNPDKGSHVACISVGSKFTAVFLFLFSFVTAASAQADSMLAQQNRPADMATTMRSNGKIYVVVTILVFILTGLFLYLIRLDRKISRLEKNN